MKKPILISLLSLLISLSGFSQTRYFVKHDADPAGNGTSWTDAHTDLQTAIDEAADGDEIWVAAGTYIPTAQIGGSDESFRTFQMKNGVAIYGGFAGTEDPLTFNLDERDFDVNETILSGDLGDGVHVFHVFRHVDLGLDNTAVLDGFTISGGKADGSGLDNKGGGMLNSGSSSGNGSSPTIRNCIFKNNEATEGGAMYNSRYSSPVVSNSTFSNNTALTKGGAVFNLRNNPTFNHCTFSGNKVTGSAANDGGGAMYNSTSTADEGPVISHCLFNNNIVPLSGSATYGGGAIFSSLDPGTISITFSTFTGNSGKYGGAIYHRSGDSDNRDASDVKISNSIFEQNTAEYGGAIFSDRHNTMVTSCIIRGNEATEQSGGFYGRDGSSKIINSLLSGNKSGKHGGGIYFNNETPEVINTTISGNYAGQRGGGISIIGGSTVDIKNTIVWGNVSPQGNELWLCDDCTANIGYSLYGNGTNDVFITSGGDVNSTNSLNSDPLFFNPLAPDASNTPNTAGIYMIQSNSPAVDTGLNAHLDDFDVTKDLRGGPRIVDGNENSTETIDIGAYEYNPTCSSNPPIAGTGTETNPYIIAEPGNFCWMAQNPAEWNKHYKQITAIDLTGSENLDGNQGLRPIGNNTIRFTGSYDGQGFNISNLTINRPAANNVGLFGVIDGQSTQRVVLQNINLVNVNITGNREVGGLVGLADQFNEITNCHVSGTVKGSRNTGGLVGWGRRTDFLRCSSSAVVLLAPATYALYHGGLIGHINTSSTVKESFATGNVSGRGRVGGLIGAIGWRSFVEDSYARGNVSSDGLTNPMIGGLIGEVWNAGVRRSFSTGKVDKEGLTGDFGGLVGTKVTDSHFYNENNFWDKETSGVETSELGTGKSTAEMKTQETFADTNTEGLNEPWDFSETWDLDAEKNDGYPYLRDNSGDCENPNDGGTIAESQTICFGTFPEAFTSTASPSGHTGILEYKWQYSTTSEENGFNDIDDSNSEDYSPAELSQTKWFRRLARVTCAEDWEDAVSSNVVKVSLIDQPTVSVPSVDPDLDITHFDYYELSAIVDPGDKTIKDVSFVIRPQTASETNLNWDFLTDGTPYPNPNEPFVRTAVNTGGNNWSFDELRPDDIYPEIAFIFDITKEPSRSHTWRDSYDLMHFTNPFDMGAKTSFFIELYATPEANSSRVLQVYLVGNGFDIEEFETGEFADEDWQDHANVELVGSINRDQDFHHVHGPNSKHFVIPLSTNENGEIGNKNIDISGDFWLILYTGHPLESRRWNLKYHPAPGCDNNGTWWKGSGTDFELQSGCPDVHVHFAREMPLESYNAMEVYVEVEYEEDEIICTLQSDPALFYFAELPNLPPNPSSFIGPEPGTYQGDVTISWNPATDPNNDPITYNVYLIGEGGTVTHTLTTEEEQSETSITFDSNEYENGDYDIMVEACDAEFCTGFFWSSNVDEAEGEFFRILNCDVLVAGGIADGTGQEICNGDTPDPITAAAPTGGSVSENFTYQWQEWNGSAWVDVTDGIGINSLTYQPPALTETTSYRLQQTDDWCDPAQTVETAEVEIIVISSNATDYFRSVADGNWNDENTWESSENEIDWCAATLVPDNQAESITIRANHNVTIDDASTASNIIIDDDGTLTAEANFTVSGNWTNNGTFVPGTNLVTFSGTPSQHTFIGNTTFYNLTVSSSTNFGSTTNTILNNFMASGGTMDGGTSTFIFTGADGTIGGGSAKRFYNLEFETGANIGTAGTGNIFITGDYTNNGVFTQAAARSITFEGGETTTLSGTGTSTFGDYLQRGGTIVDASTHDFTVSGTSFNVQTEDAKFQGDGGDATVTFAGNVDIGSGLGTVTFNNILISGSLSNSTNNKDFSVKGNWTNNGTYTSGTETIAFNGTAAQNIGGESETVFYGLTVDNAAGLNLDKNQSVSHLLTLTSGLITTGENVLTVLATGDIIGGSETTHVNGKLARGYSTTATKTFPIGKGENYRPVALQYATLDEPSTVTAEVIEGEIPGDVVDFITPFEDRYWTLTQTGATEFSYFVTFNDEDFAPTNPVYLLKGDGADVIAYATAAPNYTNAEAFTEFSDFGLGEEDCDLELLQPDPVTACDSYTLPPTSEIGGTWLVNPRYFDDSQENEGEEITDLTLTESQIVWIYDETGTVPNCFDEVSFQVTINPLPDTPEFDAEANTHTYDGTEKTAVVTVNTGEVIDWYTTETGTDLAAAPKGTNAGTYTAWAEARNTTTGCVSAERTEVTLTINKATLTLDNFVADSKTYDGTTEVLSGDGFDDDRVAGDVLEFTFDVAFADENVGEDINVNFTNIVISGGDDQNNYNLVTTEGTAQANITARDLILSNFVADNKTYDGNTDVLSGAAFDDDRVGGDDLEFTFDVAFADENVGENIDVLFTDIEISGGADAGNYNLVTETGTATANITAKELAITANSFSKTYGELYTFTNNEYDITTGDLLTGHTLTLELSSEGAEADADVDTYDIDIDNVQIMDNGNNVTANYAITMVEGTLTVTARPLEITANNDEKFVSQLYTFDHDEFEISDGSLVEGHTLTLHLSSPGAAADAALGTYDIIVSNVTIKDAADADVTVNYDIVKVAGTLTVIPLELQLQALLQGPYNTTTQLMNTALCDAGMLPTNQPYNVVPWNYFGNESLPDPVPAGVVDWVLIELRDSGSDNYNVLDRSAALLKEDGSLIGTFTESTLSQFHVVVYHHNHMPVMYNTEIDVNDPVIPIDLTDGDNIIDKSGIDLGDGNYGMVAGDVNHDGMLKYSGRHNDRGPIIARIIAEVGGTSINSVASDGYWFEDVNLDNQLKYTGAGNDRLIILQSLQTMVENGTFSLNDIFISPVPGYFTEPGKEGYYNDGPVNILASHDGVYIYTTEGIDNAIVDNLQFTLAWEAGNDKATQAIENMQSNFALEPQGEVIQANGVNYQVFVSITPIPLPQTWNAKEMVSVMAFAEAISGKVWIADNAYTEDNNAMYYVSIWGTDHTGKIEPDDMPTGIGDIAAGDISVFPNPVHEGIIHLVIPDMGGQTMDVTIYNLEGSLVKNLGQTTDNTEMVIDVSNLQGGVYIIRTKNRQMHKHIRFIINR